MIASCPGPANGPDKTRQSKIITLRGLRFILSFHPADLIISLSPPSVPCFAMRGRAPIPTWAAWSKLPRLGWRWHLALFLPSFLPSSARPAAYLPLSGNLVVSVSSMAAWADLPSVFGWTSPYLVELMLTGIGCAYTCVRMCVCVCVTGMDVSIHAVPRSFGKILKKGEVPNSKTPRFVRHF